MLFLIVTGLRCKSLLIEKVPFWSFKIPAFLVYISLSDSSLSTGLCFYKIEWRFYKKWRFLVYALMSWSLRLDDRNLKNSQNRDFCVGFGCLLNLVFKCLNIPTYYSYQLFTFSKRNKSAGTSSDLKYFHYNRKLSTFFLRKYPLFLKRTVF